VSPACKYFAGHADENALQGTICTTGYAVSKKGAGRLLYDIGWRDFAFPVDNEMSWRIEDGIVVPHTSTIIFTDFPYREHPRAHYLTSNLQHVQNKIIARFGHR
jgi:hypothetical protein